VSEPFDISFHFLFEFDSSLEKEREIENEIKARFGWKG